MIEFIDVVKSYPEGNHALKGVSMQIEDGEFCYLVGPSGSGGCRLTLKMQCVTIWLHYNCGEMCL